MAACLLLAAPLLAHAGCRGTPAAGPPVAAYVANRSTGLVHRATCGHVARIAPGNRSGFADLPAARAEGFRPCKHCLAYAESQPGPPSAATPGA